MASLKCNNCGYGIHYNDEPDGTEYTAISFRTWSNFSSTDKPICRYILDGIQDYIIIWKCRECGCLHTFITGKYELSNAYIPCEKKNVTGIPNGKKYHVFEDYVYETIAESGISAEEYENSDEYPSHYYAIVDGDYIYLSDNKDFTNITDIFKSIKK